MSPDGAAKGMDVTYALSLEPAECMSEVSPHQLSPESCVNEHNPRQQRPLITNFARVACHTTSYTLAEPPYMIPTRVNTRRPPRQTSKPREADTEHTKRGTQDCLAPHSTATTGDSERCGSLLAVKDPVRRLGEQGRRELCFVVGDRGAREVAEGREEEVEGGLEPDSVEDQPEEEGRRRARAVLKAWNEGRGRDCVSET